MALLGPLNTPFSLFGPLHLWQLAWRLKRLATFIPLTREGWKIGMYDDGLSREWPQVLTAAKPQYSLIDDPSNSLNFGYGGYWGWEQTGGLIEMANNVKPYFQSLEKPSFLSFEHPLKPLYSLFTPYPRPPHFPVLEKPIAAVLDKLDPSANFPRRYRPSPPNASGPKVRSHNWDPLLEFEKSLPDLGPLHGSSSRPGLAIRRMRGTNLGPESV